MGTETQLLCSVYTNSRYIFFSPRKFCCLFSLESIWNALRWLLTIVQFCGMSLTRHNNPLRIVKSNRRDGGPFFPKSCCRYCEKVYHFSIGSTEFETARFVGNKYGSMWGLLSTQLTQLSDLYFFVHVNSSDQYFYGCSHTFNSLVFIYL